MKTKQIETLFEHYLVAFSHCDLDAVVACYHIPCTLHTPDNMVLVKNIDDCRQALNEIFIQLKQANTTKIVARNASYMSINDNLLLACVDWDFIDDQGQVFADFCAVYHITLLENEWKIINVVSHELSNSINLTNTFVLNS